MGHLSLCLVGHTGLETRHGWKYLQQGLLYFVSHLGDVLLMSLGAERTWPFEMQVMMLSRGSFSLSRAHSGLKMGQILPGFTDSIWYKISEFWICERTSTLPCLPPVPLTRCLTGKQLISYDFSHVFTAGYSQLFPEVKVHGIKLKCRVQIQHTLRVFRKWKW